LNEGLSISAYQAELIKQSLSIKAYQAELINQGLSSRTYLNQAYSITAYL
jgi:hypothetical protein